jgi:MFS family permease
MAVGWNIANVGAVASDLSHDYSVGLATIGLFTTAQFVMHMTLQIPGGRAADRFGARTVASAGLLIIAGANGLALIAPLAWLAILAKALCGVGTGLAFPSGSDYIRGLGGSAFVQGIFGGGSVAAPGIALLVVPALEGSLGFRAPFVSAIAVALLVFVLLRLAPHVAAAARHAGEHIDAGLFHDGRLYRFASIHTASFGLSVVVGNWAVTLLTRHDEPHAAAVAIGSLTLLLGFFTRPLGGWVLRAHPERARFAVAASLVAGGAATVALALPLPLEALVAASAVVGLAAGIPFAIAFWGAAHARPDAPGAAVGFVNGWAAFAILVGTPLVGVAFSLPGDGRIGFVVVGIVWMLSALLTPRESDLGRPGRPAISSRYARRTGRSTTEV